MSEILLIRHGSTVAGQAGRYCGSGDPPLSAEGIAEVEALRPRLEGFSPPAAVWSSERRRCRQTAAIVSASACEIDPGLNEIDFGEWEGKTFAETGCADPELLRRPDFRFPGGEDWTALQRRLLPTLQRIGRAEIEAPLWVVGHRGTLGLLRWCLETGLNFEQDSAGAVAAFWSWRLPPAGFWHVRIGKAPTGRWGS